MENNSNQITNIAYNNDMNYKLTIFKHAFDNKTDSVMEFYDDWQRFVTLLENLSKRKGYKPKKGEWYQKHHSALISPAVYKKGTTRANANVESWSGWCALDIDDYSEDEFKFETKQEFITQLIKKYGKYDFVCYSTASSKFDHPKFRLIFPLTEELKQERIKDFWFAVNSEIGFIGDKQTKDFSRMFYVPGIYDNAFNFFLQHTAGNTMDANELIKKYPNEESDSDSLFGSMYSRFEKERFMLTIGQSYNDDIFWTSYRDCPFVSKKMVMEYSQISGTGWYKKLYDMMIAISYRAKDKGYPLTADEIEILCKEIDKDNGSWYKDRPIKKEAERAIKYVFSR